ncbi:MAG: glycosyltransferase [Candidatus Binataceae bacterium]
MNAQQPLPQPFGTETGPGVEETRLSEGLGRARPRLAIVVPCHNEEQVIRETATRLIAVLSKLAQARRIATSSFLYFVDGGSTDSTWRVLGELHAADERIKALKLTRNFGHQNALLGGLMSVVGRVDCAITIDGASTLLPIYLLGGLQIMPIGVVAEYIGKIYSEVKRRPRFIREGELA